MVRVGERNLAVVGIYATGNDFGDNHVFIPIETFRATFNPGDRLSKIRVTVDKVDHVEAVTEELKGLPGVDAVTAAEQVAAARATLGSLTAASLYGSLLLVAIGGALIVFLMVLATRERIREIGTLKALGAPNAAIAAQFVAEVIAVIALSSAGALLVAGLLGLALRPALGVDLAFDAGLLLSIFLGALGFAILGSAYPVLKAVRLSPVEAMRNT
jgi:ABC-type antimicrobial peptide transport system permease subunit